MAVEVTMPQMGESVVEGTVAKWLVHEGDQVTEDQPLCEISTDKVDTEIPSPASGVIAKIIANEGQTLPVGAKLAVIEEAPRAAQASQPIRATPPTGPAQSSQAAEVSKQSATSARVVLAPQKQGPANVETTAPEPTAAPATGRQERAATSTSSPASNGDTSGVASQRSSLRVAETEDGAEAEATEGDASKRYSPLVMKMAAENKIDLSRIKGTGIGGRVTKRDVVNYLEKPPSAVASPPAGQPAPPKLSIVAPQPTGTPGTFRPPQYQPKEGDQVEPFSRRRKTIAEHMVFSKTHSPHVGTVAEVDMTRVSRFRDQHKDEFRVREGFGLTFLPMVVVATARALREFPRMNSSVTGEALVIRKEINIGVAVDTEEGLLVPVIRGADQKSLLGIAREIEELHRKAVEKRITPDELSGGSFSVTNPGREGNLFGLAIINQPQVGILRMGEVSKRAVVIEVDGADAISVRPVMYLALSYDHRVVDGVLGNRFLYRVAKILEEGKFEL